MPKSDENPPKKADAPPPLPPPPVFDTPPDAPPPKKPAIQSAALGGIVDCYQHGISNETPWGGLTVVLADGSRLYVGKELFKSARWAGADDPVGS